MGLLAKTLKTALLGSVIHLISVISANQPNFVKLSTHNNEMVQEYGSDLTLDCVWDFMDGSLSDYDLSVDDLVTITWEYNGASLFDIKYDEDEQMYKSIQYQSDELNLSKYNAVINENESKSSLFINNLKIQDRGLFKCEVKLVKTFAHKTIQGREIYLNDDSDIAIRVISKPDLHAEVSNDDVDVRPYQFQVWQQEQVLGYNSTGDSDYDQEVETSVELVWGLVLLVPTLSRRLNSANRTRNILWDVIIIDFIKFIEKNRQQLVISLK